MANILKEKRTKKTILEIRENDRIISKQEKINEAFERFYTNLYEDQKIDICKIQEYLNEQEETFVTPTEQQLEELNKRITYEEVATAIRNLKDNKSPGPDGFNALFYKSFIDELCGPLQMTMNAILEEGIPKSWMEAEITVLPKEGKDMKDIRNYRPISLLNVDYKGLDWMALVVSSNSKFL